MKIKIDDLEATKILAERLGDYVRTGDVIELRGDLGVGKTAFAQFFIKGLAKDDREVLSPTFNLVYPYELDKFTLWHFDLYRLNDVLEVEELAIYDAFDEGVCLIEWPEIIEEILPDDRIALNIYNDENGRYVLIQTHGNWDTRMKGFKL